MIDIDILEMLEKAATPGPWVSVLRSLCTIKDCRADAYGIVKPTEDGDCIFQDGNAEFIAAVRNSMPELLAEVRSLRQQLKDALAAKETKP